MFTPLMIHARSGSRLRSLSSPPKESTIDMSQKSGSY